MQHHNEGHSSPTHGQQADANPPIVFLDFDGVMHPLPNWTPGDGQWNLVRQRRDFFVPAKVDLILALCRDTGAEIVVTSAWGESFTVAQFNEVFDGRITGLLKPAPLAGRVIVHERYERVLAFLAEGGCGQRRWVAFEDNRKHYPALDNVIFCDGQVGLLPEHAVRARQYLMATHTG